MWALKIPACKPQPMPGYVRLRSATLGYARLHSATLGGIRCEPNSTKRKHQLDQQQLRASPSKSSTNCMYCTTFLFVKSVVGESQSLASTESPSSSLNWQWFMSTPVSATPIISSCPWRSCKHPPIRHQHAHPVKNRGKP